MYIEKHNLAIYKTPIYKFCEQNGNKVYIKREDLFPYSFGGNKARKAELFFEEIDSGDFDCVVTYGSSSSNHCRIISNMCCQRGLPCYIISPQESSDVTYNSILIDLLGAKITVVPISDVHDTIENKISELKITGHKPYFIEGGGHGNIGTQAYVDCYKEIKTYAEENETIFDYIFFASGTGTTHAGLVCGKLLHNDEVKIVGISIARKNPRGRNIVIESIKTYLGEDADDIAIDQATEFVDDYTEGYGKNDDRVADTIEMVLKKYGIPLDATYTGKAFMGMEQYLLKNHIKNKNVLFIHTGGTPLFFDYLNKR